MNKVDRNRLRFGRLLRWVAVAAVVALTLSPVPGKSPEPFSFCVACGTRGLADGILNVLLFVPIGTLFAWDTQRPGRVILFGIAISTAVELAQTIIPGRDPSLGDIIFNTVGTIVGVAVGRSHEIWFERRRQHSIALAGSVGTGVVVIVLATAWLLQPVQRESVLRIGDDIVVRVDSRANSFNLDQPEYWVPAAFAENTGTKRVTVERRNATWRVTSANGSSTVVGPSAGEGWALLAYPDAIGRRWGWLLNGVWLLFLFVPVAFFAGWRLLFPPLVVLLLVLAIVPRATGIKSTTWPEWTGASLGLVIGACCEKKTARSARAVLAS